MEYHVITTQGLSATDILHLAGLAYVIAIATVVWFIMGAKIGGDRHH